MKKFNPRSNQIHTNLSDLEQTKAQPNTQKSTSLIVLTKARINRWPAIRFGLAVFVLLCLFTIMISSQSFAASDVPQASISLDDVESGELLLRAGNDLSAAVLLSTNIF